MDDGPELVSLVMTVSPLEASGGPHWWGRAVYNLFMQLIDSQLAGDLHEMDTRKPFTCSTLNGPLHRSRNGCRVSPEHTYWVRMTAFSRRVAGALLALEEHPPETVELDRLDFRVVDVTTDSDAHCWAGMTSYQTLFDQYTGNKNRLARRVSLDFASLTGFHSRGMTALFPTPVLVFGGLLNAWNEYYEPLFPLEDIRALADDHVAVSRYDLATRAIVGKDKHRDLGFEGRITYRLMLSDSRIDWLFHLLAHYAFYAGVGYQTTSGKGQVRGQ